MKTDYLLLFAVILIGLNTPQFLWMQVVTVICQVVILAAILIRMYNKQKRKREKKAAKSFRSRYGRRRR